MSLGRYKFFFSFNTIPLSDLKLNLVELFLACEKNSHTLVPILALIYNTIWILILLQVHDFLSIWFFTRLHLQ